MPTGIRASRPRRSTARPDTRNGPFAMAFHALNPANKPFVETWSVELSAGGHERTAIRLDSRFLHGHLSDSNEVGLPCIGVSGKQSGNSVHPCFVLNTFPVMLGHCFGAKPAPCGTASFCFGCAAPAGSRFLPEQVCKRG